MRYQSDSSAGWRDAAASDDVLPPPLDCETLALLPPVSGG